MQQPMCYFGQEASQYGEVPMPTPLRNQEELVALLKRERLAAGWSQQQLASRLGVGQSVVGNWEAGANRIPVDRLFDLAALFGLELVARSRGETSAGEVAVLLSGLRPAELQQLAAVAVLLRDGDPTIRALAQRLLGALVMPAMQAG
jgi:transcriptional regulator with XRE-family HTH domain